MNKIPQITESELLDYFNGKLSISEEREILAWRETCDENRRLFDTVRKENLVMREVVRARLIKGNYSFIRERIGASHRGEFRWWYGVAVAAVVGIFVFWLWQGLSVDKEDNAIAYIGSPEHTAILELADGEHHYLEGRGIEVKEQDGVQVAISNGKVVYDKKQGENTEKENVLVWNKITVPRGAGLYQVALSDGSVIWLNSDSRLEYPEKFAKGERKVRVTGEAFFDVVRDTARPFIVETECQSVTVLGTEFNVSAYQSEPVITTLVSGKVTVMPVNGSEAVVLIPGEQAVLDTKFGSIVVRQVNIDDVVSWKNGVISIENMALSEILKVVSRAYDVDFATDSLPADDIILQGSISSEETLDVFLAVLSKVADVKFKMRIDGKIEVQKLK